MAQVKESEQTEEEVDVRRPEAQGEGVTGDR